MGAVEQADHGLALMVEAAGGLESFLGRYGVIVVADHSQSPVEQIADAATPLEDLRLFRSSRRSDPDRCDVAVAASNRAAMAYLLPGARIGAAAGRRPAGGARRRRRHRLPRRRLDRGPARGGPACASGAGPAQRTSAATPGTSRATPPARPGALPERARAPGGGRPVPHRRGRHRVGGAGLGVRRLGRHPPPRRREPRLAAGRGLARPARRRRVPRARGLPVPAVDHGRPAVRLPALRRTRVSRPHALATTVG